MALLVQVLLDRICDAVVVFSNVVVESVTGGDAVVEQALGFGKEFLDGNKIGKAAQIVNCGRGIGLESHFGIELARHFLPRCEGAAQKVCWMVAVVILRAVADGVVMIVAVKDAYAVFVGAVDGVITFVDIQK
mmetsp:Transcript_35309/g.40312  ORF Transcript_35309/g.40312 Transcript_35309/m.40312 type:complete len:133 (-) Transcript_35309:367-765(-)